MGQAELLLQQAVLGGKGLIAAFRYSPGTGALVQAPGRADYFCWGPLGELICFELLHFWVTLYSLWTALEAWTSASGIGCSFPPAQSGASLRHELTT